MLLPVDELSPPRISIGTAAAFDLIKLKTDVLPTTAYFMLGERCGSNCLFCSQARESTAPASRLSRVTWPRFRPAEALGGLKRAIRSGLIRRICLQVVNNPDIMEDTVAWVSRLRQEFPLPVCVSTSLLTPVNTERLFTSGAERISFPLDAATPDIFKKVKGGDFKSHLRRLLRESQRRPGRIMTHLIAGVGESEEAIINLIRDLAENKIGTGLFAFTPLRGTPMQNQPPPDLSSYRRIQIAHFLIRNDIFKAFNFSGGNLCLESIPGRLLEPKNIEEAFRTSGCPDCNRPYYNERPGGILYNFPRPLGGGEIRQALARAYERPEGSLVKYEQNVNFY
jgi:biotin synthase-related radical SAM superfamily protein